MRQRLKGLIMQNIRKQHIISRDKNIQNNRLCYIVGAGTSLLTYLYFISPLLSER